MDLRVYYQTLRQTEAGITTPHCIVVSLATPDGGKAGVSTEVSAATAARMIVEGKARQATDAECRNFHDEHALARMAVEEAANAAKVHVVLVPASQLTGKPVTDNQVKEK